jgi:hypothetical protein
MLRSKRAFALVAFASIIGASGSYAADAGPGKDQLQAHQNWLDASKNIDWAHPGYFDGRKGTDVLVLAENSPAATYVVCDDVPIGQFGVAKFTSKDVPGKKSSFPVSGGAGGACYLFENVTFLQLNVASDSPRWWGRFYQSVPPKKK